MVIGPERLRKLIAEGSPAPCAVDRDYEAPLRLGFTGGTTGQPKAVTLTTRGEVAEVGAFLLDLVPDIRPGDTMLHAAPIAHASGAFFLPHLLRGARSVILPKFDAGRFIEMSEREAASCTFVVPTMLAMILEHSGVERARLAYRRLCYGAAPIAPALLGRALQTDRARAQTLHCKREVGQAVMARERLARHHEGTRVEAGQCATVRGGPAPAQVARLAEDLHEFIVEDFHDLLAGRDGAQHLRTDGLRLHGGDEVFGDLEIDIGLQQRHADVLHRIGDVGFADLGLAAELLEGEFEFFSEGGEHGRRMVGGLGRGAR
jgi:hypothetical protein